MTARKRYKARKRRLHGRSKAAKALLEFLQNNGVSDTAAALALKVTRPAVQAWTTGRSLPDAINRKRVDRWTDGAVREEWWESDAAVEAVRPFAPESNGDAA